MGYEKNQKIVVYFIGRIIWKELIICRKLKINSSDIQELKTIVVVEADGNNVPCALSPNPLNVVVYSHSLSKPTLLCIQATE